MLSHVELQVFGVLCPRTDTYSEPVKERRNEGMNEGRRGLVLMKSATLTLWACLFRCTIVSAILCCRRCLHRSVLTMDCWASYATSTRIAAFAQLTLDPEAYYHKIRGGSISTNFY